jgi:O-antigen/teichoic acid export membrane protein
MFRSRIKPLLDLFSLFAGRIGGIFVTLLFIPRYHQLLGATTFGAVSIVLSIQAFFLVSDLGLATLISRDTAIARNDPDALNAAVWNRRRAECILFAIAAVIAVVATILPLVTGPLIPWSVGQGPNIAMVAFLIMALVATNIIQLSLNALGAYTAGASTAVIGAVVRGAATVAVLATYPTLSAFLQVQLVVALVHLAGVRWYLERLCGPTRQQERLFERGPMFDLLRRCIPLTVYTLASAAAVNLDKTIVSAFISLETAGSYFLATTYSQVPVAVLSGPINSYFSPRVAHARHTADTVDEQRVAMLFQTLIMCAVVGPSLSLALEAPEWLKLWLHAIPAGVLAVAPILLLGGALAATGYYPTTYLIAAGDNDYLARLSLTCGVSVLIGAVFFATRGDLVGFAWCYFAFYAAGFGALWGRLVMLTGWDAVARLLARAYVLPLVVISGSYMIAHVLTRGFPSEAAIAIPLASAAAASLAVLAWTFLGARKAPLELSR